MRDVGIQHDDHADHRPEGLDPLVAPNVGLGDDLVREHGQHSGGDEAKGPIKGPFGGVSINEDEDRPEAVQERDHDPTH